MDTGLKMVIGMSLAYITSFAGLLLAYVSYKKHRKKKEEGQETGEKETTP
jgi:H+/gluconate symporter-like permease